uniref:G protein pathway suppressor 2 n=3 Tax=Lygus hesperus TaxID=30085 RepID=A0A146KUA8_LYGHE
MPAVVATRTQCNEQMFEALKRHILRERQKKKEEQEADAEVERQRKERELQQKQDVMTLEENREQIAKLEQTLAQLKDEKHKLFLQLKKVLNEDDNRRRQLIRQHNEAAPAVAVTASTTTTTTTSGSNEVVDMYGMYNSVPPMSGHLSHLVMPPSYPPPMSNREPMYKVPPPPHSFIPPGAMKRQRSPSPPPQLPQFHQNYNQKPTPPQPRVTYPKSGNYNYYHHNSGTLPSSVSSGQPNYGYPGQPYAPATSRADITHADPQASSKHPIYLSQGIPRPNLNTAYLHSSMDHSKIGYADDKYYPVAPIRPATHVPLHGGAIPIQQPAQGTKTGGITSGYPIRPPASAPPSHIPPVSNTTLGIYASQATSNSRLVYSQASAAANRGFLQPRQDQC